MMSLMNFDLAKALTEDRQARALEASSRRRRSREAVAAQKRVTPEADIVELVFPARCEPDQIGA